MRYSFVLCCLLAITIIACKSNKESTVQEDEKTSISLPEGKFSKLDQIVTEIGIEGKTEQKFRKIYKEYQDKRMALRDAGGKPQQQMKKFFELKDAQNEAMDKILNDEEYAKYLVAVKDSRGRPVLEKDEPPIK